MKALRDIVQHHAEVTGNLMVNAIMDRRQSALAGSEIPLPTKYTLMGSSGMAQALFGRKTLIRR